MSKYNATILVFMVLACFLISGCAANGNNLSNDNVLIGKWRWYLPDCEKGDFIFAQDSIVHNTDADGWPQVFTYEKIGYAIQGRHIIVDFGKSHGLAGFETFTRMTFKIINADHVRMVRRGGLKDLYRCE